MESDRNIFACGLGVDYSFRGRNYFNKNRTFAKYFSKRPEILTSIESGATLVPHMIFETSFGFGKLTHVAIYCLAIFRSGIF